MNCTGLTSITIPNSVTEISGGPLTNGVFEGCTNLTSVTIPNSVTRIGGSAFSGCTGLTGITIPNSVTEIVDWAFATTSLTGITIPSSVTYIWDYAFVNTSLTSVTIPAGVIYIGVGVFANCTSLTAINVEPANTNYVSESGILYTKTKQNIRQYPAGKTGSSFIIPSGVLYIDDYAFAGCKLADVTIPSSVESIRADAFAFCDSLTSVTFQGTISSIWFSSKAFGTFYGAWKDEFMLVDGGYIGDLYDKFYAANSSVGTAGMYTRTGNGTSTSPYTWTKS